jgi:hypothetical protein
MNMQIFSGAAHLQMQGKEVLQFVDVYETYAEYELLGFREHHIRVVDYRMEGLAAINRVIETGDDSQFPKDFNFSSHVSIIQLPNEPSNGDLLIELRDTSDSSPIYMLWIAIGFSDSIPYYDYVYQKKEYLGNDGSLALLSLYKRPFVRSTEKTQPIYYSLSNR